MKQHGILIFKETVYKTGIQMFLMISFFWRRGHFDSQFTFFEASKSNRQRAKPSRVRALKGCH